MIYLNDMSKCTPESARSAFRKKDCWQLLEYEAEGISGTMLAAGQLTNAPDVTLPLNVQGWHTIHVGFWTPSLHYVKPTVVKLKLTDDVCFSRMRHQAEEVCWARTDLYEAFWKYANLTGQDLVIGKKKKGEPTGAYVAYIKLEPLSAEQVEEIKQDRARIDTRKVIALNDGCSFFSWDGATTGEELLEQVELYRYSDVGTVSWAVNYGQETNYPSRVGVIMGAEQEDFDSFADKSRTESIRTLIADGVIPFETVMKHVHNMGLKFIAQFRLGILTGELTSGNRRLQYGGSFSEKHPEFRIVHKDGASLPKLSYAFPEVRDFMLSLIGEIGEYDIDGVNLCYERGPSFVGYEEPVVEAFKLKYGQNPREIDEKDERWLLHKAGYVTQFARDARKLCDEIGTRRGRKVSLSAMIYETEPTNIYHGLDIRTWLKEGLLDAVQMPPKDRDLVALTRENNCDLMAGVGRHNPENYIKCALEGYDVGAAGIAVWDMNEHQNKPKHWEILRNLGHRERVKAFARQIPKMKVIQLKTVGGMDVCHTTNKGAPENWPPEMITHLTCG